MAGLVESLRPRGALEIVDDAAVLLRRRFNELAGLAVLAVLPGVIIGLTNGIASSVDGTESSDPRVVLFAGDQAFDAMVIVPQLVLNSFGLALLAFGATRLVVAELLGSEITAKPLMIEAVKAAPKVFAVWFIVHLLQAIGLVALGVGALFAMVVLMVSIPVLAAESPSVTAVPKRCAQLTKGHRGRVFGVVLITALLSGLVRLALAFTPTSLTGLFLDGRSLVVAAIVYESLASIVVFAITAGAAVHTYVDLRVRSEGLDIDVKLRALA